MFFYFLVGSLHVNAAENVCQCPLAVVVLTEFRGYTPDPSAEGPGNAFHGPPRVVRPDSSRGSLYVIYLGAGS